MLVDSLLFILGLAMLVKGADLFVDASVAIAQDLKISPLIIGVTIVSLATTLPELIVSSLAAFRLESGLALGNAVGSCIANIGLIIGLICIIKGAVVFDVKKISFSIHWLICFSLVLFLITLPLEVKRFLGPLLILCAIIFLILNMRRRRKQPLPAKILISKNKKELLRHSGLFIIGAVLVLLGSHFLVDSGISIAKALGISATVIGLTLAAIGTSLPELVTALVSVKKNKTELSLGNIIGANVLNMTLVVGSATTIHPLSISRFTQVYSLPAMIVASLILAFFILVRKQLGRKEGRIIFGLYFLYIFGLIMATLAGLK